MSEPRSVACAPRVVLAILGLGFASLGCRFNPNRGVAPAAPAITSAPNSVVRDSATPGHPPEPSATAAPEGVLSIIDLESAGRLTARFVLEGHSAGVTAVAFSPDGSRVASASEDGTVRLWDPRTGRPAGVLEGHADSVRDLAFSPDGDQLASASEDGTVIQWSLPSGESIRALRSSSFGQALEVAYSADGLWIAVADQRCLIQIRSARTGVLMRNLVQPGCDVRGGSIVDAWGLAFLPGGDGLLTAEAQSCCGGTVQLWDLRAYRGSTRVQGPSGGVVSLAVTEDGSRVVLAFAGGSSPWLLDIASGETLRILDGHAYPVTDVAVAPGGSILATASTDRTLRVWSLDSGETLRVLEGHQDRVTSVAFSPDGRLLVSGSQDGAVFVWGLEP